MARLPNPVRLAKQSFETAVYGVLQKYGYPPFGTRSRYGGDQDRPAYEREVSPFWLKNSAENNALINNSIEEKVNQTFRRGFTEWSKEWEAKCPNCNEEFGTLDEFKLSDELDDSEVDLEHARPCPDCGEMVNFETPDPDEKDAAETMFRRANMRDRATELIPDEHNSVAQTFLEVCKEVAWDIQTFDDGWMVFERSYTLEPDGTVHDWELQEIFRVPPWLMRYSVGDDGKIGSEYWACIECRAKNPESYTAQEVPGRCDECGNRTYEVFAYLLEDITGDPVRYYTRGEFAHGSEYKPRFLYGYSPILSIWQEARTLEQMDTWYQEAYEHRRAPRGAIVVSSSNAESVRAWNTEQMEKLNADANHIATFIDDTESNGEPIKWQPLLEDPAQMQHMQMREWFLDRISAKFGVTAVFQNASAESSGLSQSLEIVVSNRSAQRLKGVYEDIFIPAFLGQLQIDGWTRGIARIEEEDEDAKAQRVGKWLQNAQSALQSGADVVWTKDDKADIKPGQLALSEEGPGGGGEGALGALMGGGEEGPAGQTGPGGGRPGEPEQTGGQPNQPDTPTTDNPFDRSAEKDTVTSGTSGYSNAAYGGSGEPAEIIDYLEHIQSMLDDEKTDESGGELVEHAKDAWEEAEFGPSVEKIEEIATQPNKNWHSMRRMSDGEWIDDYKKSDAVRAMYQVFASV